MTWMRVRLEVARSHDFPEGSAHHGYELVLPLDADGRLDVKTLRAAHQLATVHRFWPGDGDAIGQITHQRGQWFISYDPGGPKNEALRRFAEHRFRVGEYISVGEGPHLEHTCKVIAVRPAPGLGTSESAS